MGKEANITRKSKKTPVLLYRTFLKLSIASVIYAIFSIVTGTEITDSALPVTVAIAGAIAYELAYFIYKSNGKTVKTDPTRGQIYVLFKVLIFCGGVFAVLYGSQFIYGKNYLGAVLVLFGLVCCQQIHNNKNIFSHLSTFTENAAAGFVIITMELIYKQICRTINGNLWVYSGVICIALLALSEFFFHFYNVLKHKGDVISVKKLVTLRVEQFIRNLLLFLVIFLMWTLLALTGSIQTAVESGIYERVTKLLPIGISIVTASASIYLNFIKKPKVEHLTFNPQIGKGEFAEELIKRYGKESPALKALDYVTEKMNKSSGYKRYSGEDYYVHPIAVAKILMEHTDADENVVAAALLHDCVEDLPECTPELIVAEYGDEIAEMVRLVTKLPDIDYNRRETMREYLDAISENKGAALVKIADRMNNNSTMSNRDEDKKAAKADETRALYVPFTLKVAAKDKINESFYEVAEKFFKQDIK